MHHLKFLDIFLPLCIITGLLNVERNHACLFKKRPDPSRGGALRWSFPYSELCHCKLIVAPQSGSSCPRNNDYQEGELWFVDDQQLMDQLTIRINWQKEILDDLLQRSQYCDINECYNGANNCDENAECTNTVWSFTCTCDAGYSGDGSNCVDIDECQIGDNNCDENAECTNTDGSYTCVCEEGYTGDGILCDDIDECQASNINCDQNAECTNTEGSFTCACETGYTGDGVNCEDIDECQNVVVNNCDQNAECTNSEGSFTCACVAGYNGDGVSCDDIDECNGDNNCDENAECTNTVGSFTCICDAGYGDNGSSCVALVAEWKLVFKAVARVAPSDETNQYLIDPYAVWNRQASMNEDVPGANQLDISFQGHYKSSFALNWEERHIAEVKMAFLDANGTELMTMIFNGLGSNHNNWFSRYRLISSPYADLLTENLQFFSIAGHDVYYHRRWFVNYHYHNGCPGDAGWVVVEGMQSPDCEWERQELSKPNFLYSTRQTYATWSSVPDVAEADLLAIFVRTECQNGLDNCGPNAGCDSTNNRDLVCACDEGYGINTVSAMRCHALEAEWKLVFKAVAGVASPGATDPYLYDPYNVWNHEAPTKEDVPGANQLDTSFQGHYKSSFALDWGQKNITEVKMAFLDSNGTEVMTLVFHGIGSDHNSWFSKDRLISSPYDDILTEDQSDFSIQGNDWNSLRNRRWFTMRQWFGGCHNDGGWVAVVGKHNPDCQWERHGSSKPTFLYSTKKTYVNWNSVDIAEADLFAIFVHTKSP